MFSETDMVGISRPIVKHSFLVQRPEDIPSTIKKAFFIASTGRLAARVDIPKDFTHPENKFEYRYPESALINCRPKALWSNTQSRPDATECQTTSYLRRWWGGSGRGLGILTALARRLNYPVTNTLMGLGAYPGSDPQFLGMLGMHGFYEANMAMHHSDVILAVGARFDDRVTNTVSKFCLARKSFTSTSILPRLPRSCRWTSQS